MKFIFFSFLIIFSQLSYSSTYTETNTFSEWLNIESFSKLIKSAPNEKFPAIIQGGALLGDGVAFRVLFTLKPSDNFEYHITYGTLEKEFTSLNEQYTEAGFTMTHRQTVQLMHGISYQAVWVKSGL